MFSAGENSFKLSAAQVKPDTVAIVTGAAEGLGKSFVQGLLMKGAKGVCISDINEPLSKETLREFSAEFGEDRVMFVNCDVRSDSDMEDVFVKTKERFGDVNVMVNNAGLVNEKKLDLCYDINIMGMSRGTYTAIKYMSRENGGKGGRIINVASIAGVMPVSFMAAYCASKYAVVGFTKSLAADPRLAAQGITFGVLCPSFASTRILQKCVFRDQEADSKLANDMMAELGVLEPSAVRDAFLQLLLDEAWSGKVLVVKKDGISSG